ncbi:Subtilisin-like protease SBT1.7 [Colletotrichum spinosum]|uniref:Subtilisin-like protease SBT1.7 n=1 Tax=Colletotrichum spinosum TaxID=1347390 RepID=A0A4R8PWM1_9PEZI|nr:Subtilisin-like protease SBT1.7 [Colletotrichum spinosum]
MTTAYTTLKNSTSPITRIVDGEPAGPLDYGNGHVDPVAALNPGLIYNLTTEDYQNWLCAVDPRDNYINGITRSGFKCDPNKKYSVYDLNYPSFAAFYNLATMNGTYTARFTRTVTNVGDECGEYRVGVSVEDSSLVQVSVTPEVLRFSSLGETQSYVVTVTMGPRVLKQGELLPFTNGRLEWTDGNRVVGSSMAFIWGLDKGGVAPKDPEPSPTPTDVLPSPTTTEPVQVPTEPSTPPPKRFRGNAGSARFNFDVSLEKD